MDRLVFCTMVFSLLLSGCRKNSVSGSYITKDAHGVMLLQLVETPDHRLSGQLIWSETGTNGKIIQSSTSLTGAVDGENITLQTNTLFGLSNKAISGTFNGDSLTLTAADLPAATLSRVNIATYQAQLSEQEKQARGTAVANQAEQLRQRQAQQAEDVRQRQIQQQQRTVAQINETADHMEHFLAEVDSRLNLLPDAEKRYEAITDKVSGYVSRERSLAGPRYAVERGQLDGEAYQASMATDQELYTIQSIGWSLHNNITPLVNNASELETRCRQGGFSSLGADESNACERLGKVSPDFEQKYQAIVAALTHADAVYKQQKARQQALLQEADKLE